MKPYKAIAAFVLAFIGALVATIQDRTDLDTMKALDWMIVIGSALVTAGGVYTVSNAPAPSGYEGRHAA